MQAVRALVWIVVCEAAGAGGAIFTAPAIPLWYAGLAKPFLSPPSWVFAPVWTILYALMGIASSLIWEKRNQPGGRVALMLFILQLALNAAWSPVFFGLHNIGAALVIILLMLVAIAATIITSAKLSKTAAWLLAPYLLWVLIATYLNASLFALNP
jgi:tryptophan-rich sensory protein